MGKGKNINAEFCKVTEIHLTSDCFVIFSTTFPKAFPIQE
jgi:hypothetical protein